MLGTHFKNFSIIGPTYQILLFKDLILFLLFSFPEDLYMEVPLIINLDGMGK